MTTPTSQQLDEIEARANAATAGPWCLCDDYSDVLNPDGYQLASYAAPADGEFVAHARTDVPVLLAEVRRLTAELADQVRYTAALEADLCTCEPLCENGEYLHAADCPVVDVQMQVNHGPAAEETHVVADDSDDPEHVDDCPGCEAFTLTGHRYAAPEGGSAR